MKLFPKEKTILISALSKDAVLEKINNSVQSESYFTSFNFSKRERAFQGIVFSNNFHIKRNRVYRNSFLPITFGEVNSTESGSEIYLTTKMGKFQFFFFVTWTILFGIFSLISLFILIMELLYSGQLTLWALLCPAMFIVGYVYVITNFKKELIANKKFLTTLVEGKEI